MSANKKVVIVGAGPGGLASAMLLAKAGLDVTVLERRAAVGGRTSTMEAERFRFDLGPTFFLYPQILREIFAACGRSLDREVELKRLDPQYHLRFEEGGDLLATPDVDRMKERLARLNGDDAGNLEAYLADNRAKFKAFAPILQQPFSKLTDLLNPKLLSAALLVRPWLSVDSDLKRWFSDPRVRLAFTFQSKYLGMSPFTCPSLFTILSFLEYEYGVFHPIGGCGAVSQAMARVAGEMGVKIHLNEPVTSVRVEKGRATGVATTSGEWDADALVINADFAEAMRRLIPDQHRRRWTDRRIQKKKFSCSTFMMYLGIEGLEEDLAHHTIFLARDYQQNIEDIDRRHVVSQNPSFYVQNACVTDPTLAPTGQSTLYVLAPVTHQSPNVDWPSQTATFRALMYRQLEKIGLRDLEKRVRFEKVITPRDWEHDHHIHRGATFNLAHNLGQMLHRRPNNRFEDVRGVYLVGGGTHPGSGLPVIYESARISSRLLLGDLGVRVGWLEPKPPEPQSPFGRLVGAASHAATL
ncbi:MAG: phytoene desaturase [Phycisphaeraceae bacterium]|nr:phytoene desaturase [Phycisphaeraceae bacterium]